MKQILEKAKIIKRTHAFKNYAKTLILKFYILLIQNFKTMKLWLRKHKKLVERIERIQNCYNLDPKILKINKERWRKIPLTQTQKQKQLFTAQTVIICLNQSIKRLWQKFKNFS